MVLHKGIKDNVVSSFGVLHALLLVLGVLLCTGSNAAEPSSPSSIGLSGKVATFLAIDSELFFRDVTPEHVSADIRHLQQTVSGQDIYQAIIAVRLDQQGNVVSLYGTVVEDEQKDDFNSTAANKSTTQVSRSQPSKPDLKRITRAYLDTIEANGEWQILQWSPQSVIVRHSGEWRRVEQITLYAENKTQNAFVRPQLLVDTESGEILKSEEQLNFAMQAGSGSGGNVMAGKRDYVYQINAHDALSAGTFIVDRTGTDCTMQIQPADASWQNNVIVMSGESASTAYQYPCSDDTGLHNQDVSGTTGAYSPINDASFHAQVAFNLYERFSITQAKGPLNEVGQPLVVKARYGASDNASWNGEFIALGDGAKDFYPKVSADTLGHELGHAFLEHYSKIVQNAGISMGIAESFSDIAGEATEYAIAEKTQQENDWKYAAETFKPTFADAARYFENPSDDGNSISTPKQRNYEIKGHHLAGPFNKAFYHLINDNKVGGWNPIIGFDLWITAAANCWVPGMLYEPAAQCIVDSVDSFRTNNNELPNDWSAERIRYAVVRAFAKVDIMTYTDQSLISLFNYERVFDDIRLVNESSVAYAISPTYAWDIDNNGTVDRNTQAKEDDVIFLVESNATTVEVKLTTTENGNDADSYIREIEIAHLYCQPSGSSNVGDYIKQVGLNGETYTASGAESGGYADYSDQAPLSLVLNAENEFDLTQNDDAYSRQWVVFVDFNGDHDFTDAGEKIFEKKSKGSLTETVMLNQLTTDNLGKTTRMRIIMDWASMERPCAHASSGEYEDYSVLLTKTPDPVSAFNYAPVAGSYQVNFTNQSEHIPVNATWVWSYRAGNDSDFIEFSTTQDAVFDFKKPGSYSVELKLTTGEGVEIRSGQTLNLDAVDPVLSFSYDIKSKSPKVNFINNTSMFLDDATWVWHYGDGKTQGFDRFIDRHEYKYNVDDFADDVKEITVTLTVTQQGQTYQHKQTMARNQLPEAGALAWAFPLLIWLLLVRTNWLACLIRQRLIKVR